MNTVDEMITKATIQLSETMDKIYGLSKQDEVALDFYETKANSIRRSIQSLIDVKTLRS